ncbi:unnamed protein product [Mesocestoides corti]|uniref:BZIP domain-containing protein n=1 Tax=Mesocestoides corti TaxID=53468 RepID=A0A3P6I5T1_MESCO|nr:unnamed protein product [Mesocestoides corti]
MLPAARLPVWQYCGTWALSTGSVSHPWVASACLSAQWVQCACARAVTGVHKPGQCNEITTLAGGRGFALALFPASPLAGQTWLSTYPYESVWVRFSGNVALCCWCGATEGHNCAVFATPESPRPLTRKGRGFKSTNSIKTIKGYDSWMCMGFALTPCIISVQNSQLLKSRGLFYQTPPFCPLRVRVFLEALQQHISDAWTCAHTSEWCGFLPQLTKSFAEAAGAPTETTAAVSTTVQPNVIPQNSFIISSGPTDSSNNQNYILISPIGTAAAAVSSSITAPLVSSPTVVLPSSTAAAAAAAAAATSRNILLLNDSVAKTSASSDAKELDHHQDLVSSSTAGLQENSLLDSDSNRPTRPSSSDSSLLSGAPPMGRRRYSGLSSRPVTVGESLTSQLNRLEQKRARNRDAARRCRERKIRLIETLEKKVSQLTETNKQLKRELEQTQNEVECLRQFVEQHFKSPAAGGCTVPLKG